MREAAILTEKSGSPALPTATLSSMSAAFAVRVAGVVFACVAYLSATGQAPAEPTYVGSAACGRCHAPIFNRWTQTRMANVVRDPRVHPEAVLPDFTRPEPLRTFTLDDVAFVYGSKFKQRYFKKVGDDYFPFPAQWDVTNRVWRPYGTTAATGPLCDGCHSVNYDIAKKTVTEWNVGCERCHGPGSEHAARPSRATIVNPARLGSMNGVDVCVQCHSEGHPLDAGLATDYHWPVGFRVGRRLADFWRLDSFTFGQTGGLHFADGTARENRMQGNDFVQSVMYTRGVTCFSCHDPHGTPNNADLIKPARTLCLTCHGPQSPNGPHAPSLEEHSHHAAGSTGSECVGCHMPKIAVMLGDVKVRSHTFKFIAPAAAQRSQMPDSCTSCHTDKSPAWATAALRSWPQFSAWRVAQ
jgi:predicted CXXCH cytochrome family protein